jgi:hypothetical protein
MQGFEALGTEDAHNMSRIVKESFFEVVFVPQ